MVDPAPRDWGLFDGGSGSVWSAPPPPGSSALVRQHSAWCATDAEPAHDLWIWAVAVPMEVGFLGGAGQAAGCRSG